MIFYFNFVHNMTIIFRYNFMLCLISRNVEKNKNIFRLWSVLLSARGMYRDNEKKKVIFSWLII